jgi:hypothetical protein
MKWKVFLAAAATAGIAPLALAQHDHQHGAAGMPPQADARMLVEFPPALREHTLASMRDHLLSLQRIQQALAEGAYDKAADIAETRLGMSSLPVHGAREVAPYMPQGMQDAGTAMHRSASRFAVSLQETAITHELQKPLGELAQLTASCVACHAAYRLK